MQKTYPLSNRTALLIMAAALAGAAVMPAHCQTPPLITVTIVDQGPEPISLVTGAKIKTATLLDATVCNETPDDQQIDNALLYQRINTRTTQGVTLYDSQVVVRVLAVFQDKDIYAKLFKAGAAAASITAVLTTAFHTNPLLSTALQIGPGIYQAILPVVHSPQDLQQLASDVLSQASGGKLAGHSCRAGLVIARANGQIKTEVITVQ
jgi:hypothetical protein